MLILMLGFYAFLHCWLNAFAEMLRFADRMFYKVSGNLIPLKEQFRQKWKCVHPQVIQDVDEFVSSSDFSEWVPSEWESDKNITPLQSIS